MPEEDLTAALDAYRRGEDGAFDRIVGLVYDDLRRIAHRQLRRGRPGETLNTTGLVHEAYLRFAENTSGAWSDRAHFFRAAARAMRHIIIDYARSRGRRKRGGELKRVPLAENEFAVTHEAEKLIAIDSALERLASVHARQAAVVECRFFAGFDDRETAEALGTSIRTVQRDWQAARRWLYRAIDGV